jgi:hypothetical protein
MPMVNGKKYPYTPKGKAAAKQAAKKIAPVVPKRKNLVPAKKAK